MGPKVQPHTVDMGRAGGESEHLGGTGNAPSHPVPVPVWLPASQCTPRLCSRAVVWLGRGGAEGTPRAGRLRRTLAWDSLASRPWKVPPRRECGHRVPLCVASTRPPCLSPPAQKQTG